MELRHQPAVMEGDHSLCLDRPFGRCWEEPLLSWSPCENSHLSPQGRLCLRSGPEHHGGPSGHFLEPLGLVPVLSREPRPWRQEA